MEIQTKRKIIDVIDVQALKQDTVKINKTNSRGTLATSSARFERIQMDILVKNYKMRVTAMAISGIRSNDEARILKFAGTYCFMMATAPQIKDEFSTTFSGNVRSQVDFYILPSDFKNGALS